MYKKDDLVQYIPMAKFTYNNAVSETTKTSPFFVELGRHPIAGPSDLAKSGDADLDCGEVEVLHERPVGN